MTKPVSYDVMARFGKGVVFKRLFHGKEMDSDTHWIRFVSAGEDQVLYVTQTLVQPAERPMWSHPAYTFLPTNESLDISIFGGDIKATLTEK